MKRTISSQNYLVFILGIFITSPLLSSTLSQAELEHIVNNTQETYIYCDINHSKMAEIIAEISKFDNDENSPACQLHEHIQKGYSIARQDAIIQALEYAEQSLEKSYQYLTDEKIEQIQTILTSVIDAVITGKLTVNPQSITMPVRHIALDHNDEPHRSNTVTIYKPVKFLRKIAFKEDVKFKDDATFEKDVFIKGHLSVADEIINCDLTVGCNINMHDSSDIAVGNILKSGTPFIHNFGVQNTCMGIEAGNFTMTGEANVAYGAFAFSSNQNGYYNVASGLAALNSNENGSVNTAVGGIALVSNTSGDANTAIGFLAMASNVSGSGNVAVGIETLYSNGTGDDNTALGSGALSLNSTGSRNVGIGVNAGGSLVTGNDNVYIAANGITNESGIIRIGTLNTHTQSYIQGIFGKSIASGGLSVEVDSTGKLGTQVSSAQFKRNIKDMDIDSENIYNLRPVTFAYCDDATEATQYGLIAEEVVKAFPELIAYDQEGNPYSVRYQVLPVLLLNEVQKQQERLDAQETSIERLTQRVTRLEQNSPAA